MRKETQEGKRASQPLMKGVPSWRKWGGYVSERSWGSVREDYSANGDAWSYLSHDMARSKAYRWGEDGIAGYCDYFQTLVFSCAFWNGKDPILKERLFGLTPYEGNHGEDVKECYYYLDATPTHSYLRYLYKYPIEAFPYERLVEENKRRAVRDREFELTDTGVFDAGSYFDICIEYAKAEEEDTCIRIQIDNRGEKSASIHVLPQLWFRNTWSWKETLGALPSISVHEETKSYSSLYASAKESPHPPQIQEEYTFFPMYLYGQSPNDLWFTHNETHNEKVWNTESRTPFVKDAFHRHLIQKEECINRGREGTKACFYYGPIEIAAHGSHTIYLRLTKVEQKDPFADKDAIFALRKKETDDFYQEVHSPHSSKEDKTTQRTAFAGMIWTEQFYMFDVKRWLHGDDPLHRPPINRANIRNGKWKHLFAYDVLSMPDKWEYPWFAAWDLCFHAVCFSSIDSAFAKKQLLTLLTTFYQNASGQIPAYEWGFSDLNPPVQAWAFWKVYEEEKRQTGKGDHGFLLRGFLKLLHNFTWWVNRVDSLGNNVFEGGFLGLDNISVVDRSKPLPDGGMIEQCDGTGWMGFFSLLLMRIALELAKEEPEFEPVATVFLEEFLYIGNTIHKTNDMWDEEDGFFYDVILYPNGEKKRLKIRSFVGIIPFYSLIFMEEEELKSFPKFYKRFTSLLVHDKHMVERSLLQIHPKGKKEGYLFSLMNMDQMKKVLTKVFDPSEFFSDYGLRSVSKYHEKHPLIFENYTVGYEPAESLEKIKGGNSNWRGPIWIPTNFLFLNALECLSNHLGDDFVITLPGGSSATCEVLRKELENHLVNIFRKDGSGRRPVHGGCPLYDKQWSDLVLFYEHYHGDTGRGLGASHQTGWSGLIANIIQNLGK